MGRDRGDPLVVPTFGCRRRTPASGLDAGPSRPRGAADVAHFDVFLIFRPTLNPSLLSSIEEQPVAAGAAIDVICRQRAMVTERGPISSNTLGRHRTRVPSVVDPPWVVGVGVGAATREDPLAILSQILRPRDVGGGWLVAEREGQANALGLSRHGCGNRGPGRAKACAQPPHDRNEPPGDR